MLKRILVLFLMLSILPIPVIAGENHWAENQLTQICRTDGLIIDAPDEPASIELQEKLFKMTGLAPQQGLIRYWVIKHMVDALALPDADVNEVQIELSDYIDVCDY